MIKLKYRVLWINLTIQPRETAFLHLSLRMKTSLTCRNNNIRSNLNKITMPMVREVSQVNNNLNLNSSNSNLLKEEELMALINNNSNKM